ncbi:hypothetical protein HGP17_32490 [Rhizobium sp. P38BS-XIX]|uniref:hypothetical protein n=1 Tax=Rhizobium sp. P38BS-XIX TaxID=2726740 RepID=UPI0014578805|nr:hypothetical protein [Rhizobium sp. P38BS-XIX]NLS01578.1 hypothetical protein [Rhizobium sp. P38BS-XIX]
MKKALIIASLALVPAMTPLLPPAQSLAAPAPKLGDLSEFKLIANDTLKLVDAGDMTGAQKRITDFETAWDKAQSKLYPLNKDQWGVIDTAADGAISSLRAAKPSQAKASSALKQLIKAIENPSTK